MTENHGVPGSNPGPATYKSPANGRKIERFDGAAETPFLRCVNSRIKKGSLLGWLWRSLAYLLWRECRWQGSSSYRSEQDRRNYGGVMAVWSGANVHDSAPPPAATLRRGGHRTRRLVGVRRGGRALGHRDPRALARRFEGADRGLYRRDPCHKASQATSRS
jgi:hypothetical protein